MKKGILFWALAIALLFCGAALAQEELPEAVRAFLMQHEGTDKTADALIFEMPQGGEQIFLLSAFGDDLIGLAKQGDDWWYIHFTTAMAEHENLYLSRHTPAQLQPNGVPYPDDLGFDVCDGAGAVLSYHYDGTYFSMCGWTDPEKYNGSVMVQGTALAYYPQGSTLSEATYDAGELVYDWIIDFDAHPATPKEAALLFDALPVQRAARHVGYTLRTYDAANNGTHTEASYTRVLNGNLLIRREYVDLVNGEISARTVDCFPIPLSAAFQKRLETEDFDSLIFPGGYSSVFYEENVLDLDRVPVSGRVLEADAQENRIILMTENEKQERFVLVIEQDGRSRNFIAAQTPPLPASAHLDITHGGQDRILLEWEEGGREGYGIFNLNSDYVWRLSYYSPDYENSYSVRYGESMYYDYDAESARRFIGTINGSTLDTFSPLTMPKDVDAWSAAIDRSNWAVVQNPNPQDRLNLRKEPNQSADSLGKFYNGTIVRVLSQKGDWVKVIIGNGSLTGWMMKKYLVTGKAMEKVTPVFPALCYQDAYYKSRVAFLDAQCTKSTHLEADFQVIGLIGTRAYILLSDDGEIFYVPQQYLFEGNG